MPDPDDQKTASPETGSSGIHPALESMTEAVRLTSYAAAFLSPTRPFDEPGLEEDDWPEDLDGPETLKMLTHLGDIADYASTCINGIRCQHKIAEEAKPELDEIEQLVSRACVRLRALNGPRTRKRNLPPRHSMQDWTSRPRQRPSLRMPPPGMPRQEAQRRTLQGL